MIHHFITINNQRNETSHHLLYICTENNNIKLLITLIRFEIEILTILCFVALWDWQENSYFVLQLSKVTLSKRFNKYKKDD